MSLSKLQGLIFCSFLFASYSLLCQIPHEYGEVEAVLKDTISGFNGKIYEIDMDLKAGKIDQIDTVRIKEYRNGRLVFDQTLKRKNWKDPFTKKYLYDDQGRLYEVLKSENDNLVCDYEVYISSRLDSIRLCDSKTLLNVSYEPKGRISEITYVKGDFTSTLVNYVYSDSITYFHGRSLSTEIENIKKTIVSSAQPKVLVYNYFLPTEGYDWFEYPEVNIPDTIIDECYDEKTLTYGLMNGKRFIYMKSLFFMNKTEQISYKKAKPYYTKVYDYEDGYLVSVTHFYKKKRKPVFKTIWAREGT